MNGYPDGSFGLENNVTRAEFTKIAVAASSYRNSVATSMTVSPFPDVPYSHWAAPYIKPVSYTHLDVYKRQTQDFEDGYKAYAKAEMDLTRPDGKQWDWGDGGASATRPTIKGVADALGENGPLRYFGTNGAEGTVPELSLIHIYCVL